MFNYKFYPNPEDCTPSRMVWMVTFCKSASRCLWRVYILSQPLAAAQMSLLGLILSSFAYLRSAMARFPFNFHSFDWLNSLPKVDFYHTTRIFQDLTLYCIKEVPKIHQHFCHNKKGLTQLLLLAQTLIYSNSDFSAVALEWPMQN